ncbi:MAG: hypothetical protein SFV32_12155 [Opitutaceae bacterium]|nr:hypothetical protein [Opitutaceae bacterium]
MMLAPEVSSSASTLEGLASDVLSRSEAHFAQPSDLAAWAALGAARRAYAKALTALPSSAKEGPECARVDAVVEKLIQAQAMDCAAEPEDAAFLASLNPRSWTHQMASRVVAPAWEWSAAPALDDVPSWQWSGFARWIFHSPQAFSAVGQAEKYAGHHLRRLGELERWATANKGSAAVRSALEIYFRHGNCIPLYFSESSLKKHYELRARLLAIVAGVERQVDVPPFPRDGRRLRVGFVNRHFGSQTETYTTLPTFENLDKDRFDVLLFAVKENGSELEAYIKGRATEFNVLPEELSAQVQTLLAANLDVVVYGTNVTAVPNEILMLALHRVAPLQVVNNSSCTTTGLPEIDLYISGTATECADAPEHFTERLGLIPGPAHAFNYQIDRQEPTQAFTRESVGVAEDAVLFVSAANFYKVTPEMQQVWARILAAVPGSKLLVHPFNPNWSSDYPIKRFCAEFDRVLAAHGVQGALIVSSAKFPSRTDVKELLRVGDLYLDSFPFGGVNSLVDPLECGVPSVVWEGKTFRSRMGAALLRELGLPELIASDAKGYEELVVALARDPQRRKQLSERIAAQMDRSPLFLNSLAHSDAFGGLLEAAFDELVAVGRDAFRKSKTPLRVTAPKLDELLDEAKTSVDIGMAGQAWDRLQPALAAYPGNASVYRLAGRALTSLGRPDRGSLYLLEAIQHLDPDPTLWCELAESLLHSGQLKHAVEAVQACLQLDGRNVEAILLLGEVADRTGQLDQIVDAVTIAQSFAPSDPRVAALAVKVHQATANAASSDSSAS